jgi:hypothetical protein
MQTIIGIPLWGFRDKSIGLADTPHKEDYVTSFNFVCNEFL